ncbi:restriction endonuclease subunit S [Nonomuraea wenchangensis]
MTERTVKLSSLVSEGLLEIGAGRPRSVDPELPILRVADVLDGRIGPLKQSGLSGSHQQEIQPKVSYPGDLVLTTKGTVGRVAMIPTEGPRFAYSPQLCYFRPTIDGPLRSRYLYYWFKSSEFWDQASALKSQTDMADFLSLSDIYSLSIRIPPLVQQVGIGDLLGALDDKIAVNERIAAATDEYLSAAFEQLVTSTEETVELGDIAKVNISSAKVSSQGFLRYVDISSVGVGRYDWPVLTAWEDAPGRARRKARFGDTIWSTVRPNRRSHAFVLDDDPDLVFSTGLAILTPISVGSALFYEATRYPSFQKYLESVAEGSAYPAVRADRFCSAPIVLPAEPERMRFEEMAMALRLRAHQAAVENRTLAELRDTLLPQLMSGRLRVRDAERIVEDMT